jgi:activating signal cointegrator 1
MKALTLYHPWAMLVEIGWKEVETRDWYTGYRGPLAIHASRHWTSVEGFEFARIVERAEGLALDPEFLARPALRESMGCIVAIADLVGCIPTAFVEESAAKLKPPFTPARGWAIERIMGNYEPGRWAWILRNVRRVVPYIPAKGHQKLWPWEAPAGYGGNAGAAGAQTSPKSLT